MQRICVLVAAFGLIVASHGTLGFGQDIPRYSPSRPTVSPYLNLLRNDTGPLPNYYSLVRPQLDQRSYDAQASRMARSNSIAIRNLSSLSGSAAAGQTGSGSAFNNLSHFYPAKTGLRQR